MASTCAHGLYSQRREHTIIVQETLDQVDVGEDHAAAAVALELELCQSLALCAALDQ